MKKGILRFKKSKWFFEEDVPYDVSRIKIGMEIKRKIYSGRSDYQRIEFFDTYAYDRILVLDGILQTSEKDEFIYHEMLCQLPMFLHKNPKRILIIGGGDGGSLEEVLKHKIEKVWMAEIDEKVIELSKKYISSISKGAFKNKKAEIIIGDGKKYIKRHKNFFDVIILDLSDPLGPSKELISLNFYQNVKRALRKDGVVSIQSGSLNDQPELVSKIFGRIKKIFPFADIHWAVVPSYQTGEYSFIIGAKENLGKLTQKDLQKKYKKSKLKLKYFSPEIYFASRVLPKYLAEKIGK
ncbi:MAG: polyamine aminopropyltransferase [Candidatus Pacebacteria bacterium]|nr:polyamine aminopropyltransferase [Candidatus Paceibacterota bacterium]